MDLSAFSQVQLLAAASGGGVVLGAFLAYLTGRRNPAEMPTEDPRNHRIRELEADLRTSSRQHEEVAQALEAKSAEFNTAIDTLQQLRAELAETGEKLAQAQEDLQGSVAKTRELRQELQDRATETVREQLRAEEAATELEVARAGSEAVLSEINRLQEERKHLSETVAALGNDFIPEDELFGES